MYEISARAACCGTLCCEIYNQRMTTNIIIDDHIHCCPHGYTCDTKKGQCREEISIPWFTKKPAFRSEEGLLLW